MPWSRGSTVASVTTPCETIQMCEVVVVVSSSRPSSPRKTQASVPRRAKTPAMTGAAAASAQPIAEDAGRAGLVSGPSRLKTVAMPISRRAAAACRIAGWKAAANRKVIPASSATSPTRETSRSSRMPSASSTSADPDLEEADRLPCLTILAPAPAATIADIVEMLTEKDRSPPVPTMSSTRPGTKIGLALASMPSATPASSSTVSPLARSATAKAAICAGVASPARISPIAHAAWCADRDCPATSVVRTSGQESGADVMRQR